MGVSGGKDVEEGDVVGNEGKGDERETEVTEAEGEEVAGGAREGEGAGKLDAHKLVQDLAWCSFSTRRQSRIAGAHTLGNVLLSHQTEKDREYVPSTACAATYA